MPESYILEVKDLGFDGVWLMGVWLESPASREIARSDAAINAAIARVKPGYKKEDIIGSQFSIYGYEVNPVFGGKEALLKFKEKLNSFGIKLILDFAANHLSIDNPLTLSDPDIFIRHEGDPKDKNLFFQTKNGAWLAHGRDPYFPPWTDTVQINHFSPKARVYLMQQLFKVIQLCDGLRCDMVMLMFNKVFKDTWGKFVKAPPMPEEFWPGAIKAVREEKPDFVFVAEVYWGLEWEVQQLGFDYTYDKILYDRLLLSTPQDIQGHLNAEHLYQKHSIRFIANHDEEAPVTAFGREKSKAAAAVVGTINGARLFTLPQVFGEKFRLPIQYAPQTLDKDEEVFAFYKKLLEIINHPCFHGGQWVLKIPKPAADKDDTFKNVLAWGWTQLTTCKLVVINYKNEPSNCFIPIDKMPKDGACLLREEFTQSQVTIPDEDMKRRGIKMELRPYEVRVFSVDF